MKGKPAPKISTEQLCKDYYDSQIFNARSVFEFRFYAEILRVDVFAKTIDSEIFIRELTALNIELFGLAWFDHNYQGGQGDDSATCTEITFTKSYLKQMGNENIWSAAGFYNEAIFQARTAQRISMDWSVPRDTGYYERGVLFPETKSEKLMGDSIRESYNKRLADKECASRLTYRLLSVDSWREGIMIPQQLSSAFAQRLNFSPNIEAFLLLQRLTIGLYKNAKDYIDAVIGYGSWKLAREESNRFIKHIIRVAQKDMESEEGSEK